MEIETKTGNAHMQAKAKVVICIEEPCLGNPAAGFCEGWYNNGH